MAISVNTFYNEHKVLFHKYITKIKNDVPISIYSVINTTLIKNPFTSVFPKRYFKSQTTCQKVSTLKKLLTTLLFFKKYFKFLFYYFVQFIIFKIYNKTQFKHNPKNIVLDSFFIIDQIIKQKKITDRYFHNLYTTNQNISYIARLHNINENWSSCKKLIKFIQINNNSDYNILLEFNLLRFKDFFSLFFMILSYPIQTLKLQQEENTNIDKLFNHSLIEDMNNVSFKAFSRYIFGKNIALNSNIKKIYSWSEFQVIERSFNYGIRKHNTEIRLVACQLFINYETYFNTIIDEIDYIHQTSPHQVLVNGKYYLKQNSKITYEEGVSLRYKDLFSFKGTQKEEHVLILGSYFIDETLDLLKKTQYLENTILKTHPIRTRDDLGEFKNKFLITDENIYKLFENTKLVIGSASGSLLEAVASGISVLVIANNNSLVANPLVEYGQGKIWDISFNQEDVKIKYNQLLEYRKNNQADINNIANWYKENFFIEPTVNNIINVFNSKGNQIK